MRDLGEVDRLAQLIRVVDGNGDLGAGVLAEKLVEQGVRCPAPGEGPPDPVALRDRLAIQIARWDRPDGEGPPTLTEREIVSLARWLAADLAAVPPAAAQPRVIWPRGASETEITEAIDAARAAAAPPPADVTERGHSANVTDRGHDAGQTAADERLKTAEWMARTINKNESETFRASKGAVRDRMHTAMDELQAAIGDKISRLRAAAAQPPANAPDWAGIETALREYSETTKNPSYAADLACMAESVREYAAAAQPRERERALREVYEKWVELSAVDFALWLRAAALPGAQQEERK